MDRRTVQTPCLACLLACLLVVCVCVCVVIFVLVFVSQYPLVPAQAPGFPSEGMKCRAQNLVP